MAQAITFENGKKHIFLQGAGTRFATWFHVMHQQPCLKKVLMATVHCVVFDSVAKNAQAVLAVEDIEDEVFGE